MPGSTPYIKVLDFEQTLTELTSMLDTLRQERDDLEIALTTAIEHGDAIESQLELANRQLQNEVRERLTIERQLRDLVTTITQKSRDLEVVLQTITEHADEIDLHWLARYMESETVARHDPLTGLANRRLLDETIAKEWTRARREGHTLALLMCDMDHFKTYNDHYGHSAGDDCLQRIAGILREVAHREGDLVARYGGEEFVVVLPNTELEGARAVAERIRSALAAAALPHAGSPLGVITVSIGVVARSPLDGDSGDTLFAEADRLLYVAKQKGRDNIVCADHDAPQ